jgi:N-acetyl sugar amidotransferase
LKWCQACVLPDSRPGLSVDNDGVCNACRSHGDKPTIDWHKRRELFDHVVENAKRCGSRYDCVVPVSGGKDSTWQVKTCLEAGLHPLAVTWRPPGRSELGQANLDNLISLGVDHIDFSINPRVERVFMWEAFRRLGSTAIPMHMAIFNIPLRVATLFEAPLVIWGENSAFEYGGDDEASKGFQMDANWLQRYGVMQGTSAKDWVGEGLSSVDLTPYFGPNDADLQKAGVLAVFLGHYFQWDPIKTFAAAKEAGFRASSQGARTGLYDFADIDDDFISVHHFMKWYKFGFTRLFDNLSLEIRNGRATRDEAIDVIRKTGLQVPVDDIKACCEFMRIGVAEFYKVAETFRNLTLWKKDGGRWVLPDFLVEDWSW